MTLLDSVFSFVIPAAYAEPVPTAGVTPAQNSNFSMLFMLIIFVAFMYFAVWRPQAKRAKEQRELINSLAKGDEVMTAGGILGRIAKVMDNYIVLSLSENVEITLQKSSVVSTLPKGTLKSIQ